MILAAHSLGSREDGVLKLEMCKGDGYSVVRRKIIEGLRNQIGEEGGEIEIVQVSCDQDYRNVVITLGACATGCHFFLCLQSSAFAMFSFAIYLGTSSSPSTLLWDESLADISFSNDGAP